MRPEDQRSAAGQYTVVARTLIFLTRGSKVLLLKGAPTKRLWAGKYNGIGGHLEPGESPYASALRELGEETGLTVDALALRGLVHVTLPEPPGVVLFVFVGESSAGDPVASDEGTPEWVEQTELAALPLVDDLPALLPRVLVGDTMTYAHYMVTNGGLEIRFDPGCSEAG
ncbi:MAG: 8-oxo-dGTP diphosphatase [Anaerolineae bacterium]|jgi:8-oxo-dGTP diphosphatase|nr:8-oxo-dGTP diphosphatase [Anaerolineae bacterium]